MLGMGHGMCGRAYELGHEQPELPAGSDTADSALMSPDSSALSTPDRGAGPQSGCPPVLLP